MKTLLRDTGNILGHALGIAPPVDLFLEEKFEKVRGFHRSPILDFGAGTCFFTMYLKDRGFDVTAVDVVDHCRYPAAQMTVFEGPKLPYATGAFETSLSHFVLHHIRDQAAAFEELVRVTRGTIIVSEDVADSWHDSIFHRLHTGTSPWSRSWNGFRSTTEWREFFARFPVQLVEEHVIPRWRTPHYPVRRVVFVLRVVGGSTPG